MKVLYSLIGLLFVVFLISGCAKIEAPTESRSVTFWGTAEIKAQVLETSFPTNNKLTLKVLEINDYSLDGSPERSLSVGDEIDVVVARDDNSGVFDGWNALDLEEEDIINIKVRREGSSYRYSTWDHAEDTSISLVE